MGTGRGCGGGGVRRGRFLPKPGFEPTTSSFTVQWLHHSALCRYDLHGVGFKDQKLVGAV